MNFLRKIFGNSAKNQPATGTEPAADQPLPVAPLAPISPSQEPEPPVAAPLPAVTAESITISLAETFRAGGNSITISDPVPSSEPVKVETTLLTIDGPVWLPGDSPAIELFAAKPDDAAAIAFIGGSAELPQGGFKPADDRAPFALDPGALSRALPLYLADQVELGTDALTRTLVSWMVKPRPGFMLGGQQWDDATAAHHARQTPADDPSDYVVLSHLVCTSDPWRIEVRVVRTIDSACLATLATDCDPSDPGASLPGLTAALLAALAEHAELPALASGFETPAHSTEFLALLDQLLALRTAALPGAAPLRHEGNVLDGMDRFARQHSASLPARLLFTHTLSALARVHPELCPALAARVESLQRDLPLAEPAQSVLARIRREMLAT